MTADGAGLVLRVVVKTTQLNKLVYEHNQGATISMSAMKSGVSRNTARKHLRQGDVMEQRQVPHDWRTRKDPLEAIWPRAQEMLRGAPELEAKALFEHLRGTNTGMGEGLLRTFQRRVRRWRLVEGPEKEVFFTQDHPPGETLAVDWTDMGKLAITVQGRSLEHKLFHAVLPHSNWQWAVRARSESILSLRGGLKATLGRLGRGPRKLLVDHSSTATHQLGRDGKRRGFNQEFLSICAHYGMEPRVINVARPQENGDCESEHGHLKRRMVQHLLLRGSRDFGSEEEYDRFLIGVLEAGSALRTEGLKRELAVMKELGSWDLPDYREVMVRVGSNSTIRVSKRVYSVPSRLIGAKVLARIYETRIVLLEGATMVAELPVVPGAGGAVIDPRHIISHLVRKPGAFAAYRWRQELFPSETYRAAYSHLERVNPEADKEYLKILEVAVMEGFSTVENALEQLFGAPRPQISARDVKEMLEAWREDQLQWRQQPPWDVRLEDYDGLLGQSAAGEEVACEF